MQELISTSPQRLGGQSGFQSIMKNDSGEQNETQITLILNERQN
jgi:hypothetical protein